MNVQTIVAVEKATQKRESVEDSVWDSDGGDALL
jgi:hypothetical protein